jgi:hypothetical protein
VKESQKLNKAHVEGKEKIVDDLFLAPPVNEELKLQKEGRNMIKGYLQINSSQSLIGFVC